VCAYLSSAAAASSDARCCDLVPCWPSHSHFLRSRVPVHIAREFARPGGAVAGCLLEYKVIWGHIDILVVAVRRLSRRWKVKTLLAGPSHTSPMKAEITVFIDDYGLLLAQEDCAKSA